MKNYFFINNHSPAAVYGIGTYASQIVKTIKEIKDINFIYVDISSDEVSFVETRDSIGLLHLKMPNVGTTMEDIWYNKCVYYYISKWVYSNCKKNDINVAQGGLSVAGGCRCLTKDGNTSIEKEGYIPYPLQA